MNKVSRKGGTAMKESRFNLFYPARSNPNKILAYNSKSNALATINKDDFDRFKKCSQNGVYDLDEEFLENLKRGNFLIEDDVDELDVLRYQQQSTRYNSSYLGLTIAPTLGCNFRCVYCYEKEHDDIHFMREDVQKDLLRLIEEKCKKLDLLSVAWYGGEPLLAFDLVKSLSKKFIEICDKYGVRYQANIITNGYLLNKEIVKELEDIHVKHIQVTIDGPKDIHDKRRFLKGKQGTFDKIFKNLKNLSEYSPSISLRINVDRENCDRVNEIVDLLEENNLTFVTPYLGYVEPTNDMYDKEKCLTISEFADIEFQFSKRLNTFLENIKYPNRVINNCCADCSNSLVIDPDGHIYKCWSDVGISEYSIGTLFEVQNEKKLYEYGLYDPTLDEVCKNCTILPICMGGCPRRRIDNVVERCSPYKYNLEDCLQEIYERKNQEMAQK